MKSCNHACSVLALDFVSSNVYKICSNSSLYLCIIPFYCCVIFHYLEELCFVTYVGGISDSYEIVILFSVTCKVALYQTDFA